MPNRITVGPAGPGAVGAAADRAARAAARYPHRPVTHAVMHHARSPVAVVAHD
ncbi:hypothetical protein ACFY04_42555 [Streptomyces sp. NPDC001549]|uniref:hypothetical protein n=1 Tax=Streptomyces sp. NPDC001549 TaxID=3364586 RepID=UPI00369714A8